MSNPDVTTTPLAMVQEKTRVTRTIALVVSIPICLGAAVSYGYFYWFLAAPWFLFLLYQAVKSDQRRKVTRPWSTIVVLVFGAICMATVATQDSNPWIYPILKGGTVTIKDDPATVYKVMGIAPVHAGMNGCPDLVARNGEREILVHSACQYSFILTKNPADLDMDLNPIKTSVEVKGTVRSGLSEAGAGVATWPMYPIYAIFFVSDLSSNSTHSRKWGQ